MVKTIEVTDRLHDYLVDGLSELPVLQRLRAETAQLPMARMQISPLQGQFMGWLMRVIGAKKTLEIGVFTGYSALCTALALPADGHVVACDVNEEWTSIARRYWAEAGLSQKIDLNLAPAVETLDRLIHEGHAGTFDFVFIDADKGNYDAYYERSLTLIRSGGVIMVDNALWSGAVADLSVQDEDTVAIRTLNEKIFRDARVVSSLLPVSDGLLLAYKK